MVSWSEKDPPIGVWFEELGCGLDQAVEVSAFAVLGPALAEIAPPVVLALHRAEEITDIQDPRVPLYCLLEMDQF